MVRCITCNVFHMRKFCRFFYCLAWFETVEFNRLPCPNNEKYGDASFAIRFRHQLAIFGNACTDMAISTPSCSYFIWNTYWQNHRSISPNFLLFAWFDTLEFNRPPWIQSSAMFKQQDIRWCGYRWSIPLSIGYVWNSVLIWLSWLLHAHIAYITDGAKIIAAFCRISYCLHDLIRLNSIAGYVQSTRCTMMRISLIDSAINWLSLEFRHWYGYLDSFMLILHI